MADKLLLSVSATQVSAARWRGGGFAACDVFSRDEIGLAAFAQYLTQVPYQPVHLMVDAVEEDYRFESLPHSFGPDRSNMVNRKLKQYYRNTPYASAFRLGRDQDKRRDDRYLFCALTNPELIKPWVDAVIERGLPLAGIYLLPTASQALIDKLQLKAPSLLVVSIHSSGTRLTYFRDQKLRASRLARIDSSGTQPVAEEISNTRLYLHGLRVMTLDEPLVVLIVDRGDTLHEVAQTLVRDNPSLDCQRLGPREIVAKLGISAKALESSPDALYLHLLGLRAPGNNLAPAAVTVGYRRHQAKRYIYGATIGSAFAATVWCMFNAYEIWDTRSQTEDAARQTAQLQTQYQEITRQFPVAPTTADNLKRTVEISRKIGGTTRSPESMLKVVSQALDSNPSIILKTLGWRYGPTDLDAGGAAPNNAGEGGLRHESGLVEGEVRPFRGDYRAAIATINHFAEALAQQPQVAQVRVVTLPLNISPTLTLSGNTTDDGKEQTGKAEFKLVLTLKQPT